MEILMAIFSLQSCISDSDGVMVRVGIPVSGVVSPFGAVALPKCRYFL